MIGFVRSGVDLSTVAEDEDDDDGSSSSSSSSSSSANDAGALHNIYATMVAPAGAGADAADASAAAIADEEAPPSSNY